MSTVTTAHGAFRSAFRDGIAVAEELVAGGEFERAAGLTVVLSMLHAEAFDLGVDDLKFQNVTADIREAIARAVSPGLNRPT